jgi:hypothetical protein
MIRWGLWLRRGALLFGTLVLMGALLTGRALVEGEREMRRSDAAFDRGDVREAVLHARRAAIAYAPGAPHLGPAFERLTAVAIGAEAAGDADVARLAWRAVRSAALETRHFWIPERQRLERANRELARLQAGTPPRRAEARRALQTLSRDDAPRAGWALVLGLGFVLTLSGLAWCALSGITRDGELRPVRARWGLLLTLLGAVCWTIAVYRA